MNIEEAMKIITKIVNDPETLRKALRKENAFTQNQILGFKSVISIMLDYCDDSMQSKITRHTREHGKTRSATKQALSKALSHIDESPFVTMFQELTNYVYNGEHLLKTYKKHFLLAVDGSYFNVPRTLENLNYFDKEGKSTHLKLGGAMIYDVLNNVPIDFAISKTFMNERKEFLQQLESLNRTHPHVTEQAILIFDRGYRSLDVMTELSQQNKKFVMRVSDSFLKDVNKALIGDHIVTLKNGLKLRVFKFLVDKDETFILCTNLFDFSEDELKEIYRFRWIVETCFNTAKNKLFVDKNQGKTVNYLLQSYWATMVKMIFLGIVQNECDSIIESEEKKNIENGIKNIHRYKTNTRILIQTLDAYYVLAGFAKRCWEDIFIFSKTIWEAVKRKVKKTITNSINIEYIKLNGVNSYVG